MAEIPAPLANRHTAVAVVAVSLLGASSAVAAALVPDSSTALWLLVVRQVVFAVQALVIALAAALVGRTLVRRDPLSLVAIVLAGGGLALLALAHLGGLLLLAWNTDVLATILGILVGGSTVATAVGLLLLGIGVLRKRLWHGPTRWTLPLAALLVAAGGFVFPLVYAAWSLVCLGLASGLTSRRPVANAGVPQGAAPA